MGRDDTKSPILAVFIILAIIVVTMILGGREKQPVDMGGSTETANLHPNDLRYFHPLPGRSAVILNPADASAQVKGVAANRHVSPQEVRRLMDDHTEGRGEEPMGKQRINVQDLNQALDERWPIK
jgi:hypothetical protein